MIYQAVGFNDCAGIIINQNSLYYLINIVNSDINGKELYPKITQKAAVYAFNIITRHVFVDGNKRTGMACAFFFLKINGYNLSEELSEDEIVNVALGISKGSMTFEDLSKWFDKIVIME